MYNMNVVILKGKPQVGFFKKWTALFFLDVVGTRELVRLKALCVSYIQYFFQ
eukprot:UN24905